MNPLLIHRTLGTLALVALSACASLSGGAMADGGPGGSACPEPPAPRTLLTVDCRGLIAPGLAGWEVSGSSIVLDIGGPNPTAARRLVESWPSVTQPPWLGHPVRRIVVLPDNRVRVEFQGGGRSGAPVEPLAGVPLLLFADPRLGPPEYRLDESRLLEDVRDRIDVGDSPVFTRHEHSVSYGRTLGRDVTREAFDRRYVIVAPHRLADGMDQAFHGAVVDWWVRGGVEGARRPAASGPANAGCSLGQGAGSAPPRESQTGPVQLVYPAGDLVAKEIAERLVSASLPGGLLHEWLPDGFTVRSYAGQRPGSGDLSGTLQVLAVPVGSVHACSIRGEIALFQPVLGVEGLDLTQYVVPVGETALFRVGPQEPRR